MLPATKASSFLIHTGSSNSCRDGLLANLFLSLKSPIFNSSTQSERVEAAKEKPIHKFVGSARTRYGRLHVCGLSITGALGVAKLPIPENKLRTRPKYHQPYPYPLIMDNIDKAACGYGFSIFSNSRKDTIKIWGCGINTDSQLGFHKGRRNRKNMDLDLKKESYKYLMEPAPIPLPLKHPEKAKVNDVACGRAHTVILTDTEGVFTFGNNALGQCGRDVIDGEIYENSKKIHNIPASHFSSPVSKVVCGMDHTLFLTKAGQVYACGWGADGQTGLGHVSTTSVPTQLKGDLVGVKITQLSSFADTTLALSDKNEVFAWGSSEYGQLANISNSIQVSTPTRIPFKGIGKITQVAVGGTACMLLDDDGNVWVWGYGILGKGPNLENAYWPEKIPLTLFGLSDLHPNVRVTRVRSGLGSFAAITNTGALYTWGKNRSGCLGIGSHRDQYFPWRVIVGTEVVDVKCGVDHMIILSKRLL